MKLILSIITIAAMCHLSYGNLMAQSSLNSSGGQADGIDGEISYSFGQLFTQSQNTSDIQIIEGVQQLFDFKILAVDEPNDELSLTVKAYPNPTSTVLFVSIDGVEQIPNEKPIINYQLLDLNGRLLKNDIIDNYQVQINTDWLMPGLYLLKLFINRAEIKTLKIIKK